MIACEICRGSGKIIIHGGRQLKCQHCNGTGEFLTSNSMDKEDKSAYYKELLIEMYINFPEPPDKNCTCHISPPCADCVEYSNIREILENVKEALK